MVQMEMWELVVGIILMVASLFIIVVVMLQESKQTGLGAISGDASDSYYAKGGGRTKEAKLKRLTKVAAFIFIIVAIAANIAYKLLAVAPPVQ